MTNQSKVNKYAYSLITYDKSIHILLCKSAYHLFIYVNLNQFKVNKYTYYLFINEKPIYD